MGEKRNVYRLLVGKPEGRRPLRRPRRRWLDNIRMGLAENFGFEPMKTALEQNYIARYE
jgi:hypothetical protein